MVAIPKSVLPADQQEVKLKGKEASRLGVQEVHAMLLFSNAMPGYFGLHEDGQVSRAKDQGVAGNLFEAKLRLVQGPRVAPLPIAYEIP